MSNLAPNQVLQLFQGEGSVNQRLAALHDRVLQTMPAICRIACALYEQSNDLLKTFINSTREGLALHGYEAKLSDCGDLRDLASNGTYRVIDDISTQIRPGNQHSDWLLSQPYRSSFTVPMYDHGSFLGFIFFDSTDPGYFDARVQRDLLLYCNLINMALSAELSAVRAVLVSAQVAREFVDLRDFETGAHLERILLQVKPGITGLASLKYKNEEQLLAKQEDALRYNDTVIWPDKVRINRWYLHNRSLKLDLIILAATFLNLPLDVDALIQKIEDRKKKGTL